MGVPQIARELGISPQAVYGWKKGSRPKAYNLIRLAEITGYDARYLEKGVGSKQASYARNADQACVLNAMTTMSPYEVTVLRNVVESILRAGPAGPPQGQKKETDTA